jgi:AhpD family alkylhydroperoxidase
MTVESQTPSSSPGSPGAAASTADAVRAAVKQTVGFIPNAVEEMLISPAVAQLVLTGKKLLAGASLSAREQSAIELFIAVRAGCAYCRTWHEGLGLRTGLSAEEMRLIVAGRPPADARLGTLLRATELVQTHGGRIAADDLQALESAGINRAQMFEIIALVGLNVITNGVNTLAGTPPDERFVGVLERA